MSFFCVMPTLLIDKPAPLLAIISKYLVRRCLEPLKAEPQEMFGGSNSYSQDIWKTRDSFWIMTLKPETAQANTAQTTQPLTGGNDR